MEIIPDFEYDPDKSAANLAKHGIDFESAKGLWLDQKAVLGTSNFSAEPRHLLIGSLAEKVWTAVFTVRDGRVRLISVRRARAIEVTSYERQADD